MQAVEFPHGSPGSTTPLAYINSLDYIPRGFGADVFLTGQMSFLSPNQQLLSMFVKYATIDFCLTGQFFNCYYSTSFRVARM